MATCVCVKITLPEQLDAASRATRVQVACSDSVAETHPTLVGAVSPWPRPDPLARVSKISPWKHGLSSAGQRVPDSLWPVLDGCSVHGPVQVVRATFEDVGRQELSRTIELQGGRRLGTLTSAGAQLYDCK